MIFQVSSYFWNLANQKTKKTKLAPKDYALFDTIVRSLVSERKIAIFCSGYQRSSRLRVFTPHYFGTS
jgi:hypothetical protein